jgi:hypothetical protein
MKNNSEDALGILHSISSSLYFRYPIIFLEIDEKRKYYPSIQKYRSEIRSFASAASVSFHAAERFT